MFYVFCFFTPLFRHFRLSRVFQTIDLEEIYRLVSKSFNPPRPLASRRVEAVTLKPSKPPKPQTSPQGGGFTLPLPPPRRYFSARSLHSWGPPGPLDPSKSDGETQRCLTIPLFVPAKPQHVPITLAIQPVLCKNNGIISFSFGKLTLLGGHELILPPKSCLFEV